MVLTKMKLFYENETFSLRLFLEDVIQSYRIISPDTEFELDCPEAVSVSTNKNGLLEILRILIKNSIDYSPKPAHIILQWKNDILSVKDRGNGISPQDLPYIFDRFYRADKARTRKSAGSGLGLSIAKALAQRLNLSIRAESIEKQGTTISIEFSPESVLYHDRNLNEKPN